MESRGPGGAGSSWWVAWVLWCAPAGALAGVGLIEFNWGGPPYDGGFMGDLVLFGGFLAVGQAPLVSLLAFRLRRGVGDRSRMACAVAVCCGLSWVLAGFVGWGSGSYFEVGFATPLYSDLGVLAGALPWLIVGALEGVVLMSVLAARGRVRVLVSSGVAWVAACAIGGLFYEYWASLDIAARQNRVKDAIGASLEGVGFAENVAFEVVPAALAVPILYGLPTGLALAAFRRRVP